MSNNSTNSTATSSSGGGGGSGINASIVIAIVALVVSVIALVGTMAQVAQQYLASAAGYANCDASVIGQWHITKKRQFRLSEMQFRVLFETPVFFVCPATNRRGPVPNTDIWFVKGTDESMVETRATDPEPEVSRWTRFWRWFGSFRITIQAPQKRLTWRSVRQSGKKGGTEVEGETEVEEETAVGSSSQSSSLPEQLEDGLRQRPKQHHQHQHHHHHHHHLHIEHRRMSDKEDKRVTTADSEMSTWVRLLQQLHAMERESRQWQDGQYALERGKRCTFAEHRLCVALQPRRRLWNTMPASVRRPFATTTISHLVEMAAMLGIYWKEFDVSGGRYLAEGNGHVLTGSHVVDLGLLFTFQICGRSRFQENRLVPADEAKEFAFGVVPTVFRSAHDIRHLSIADDVQDMGLLHLGSRNELAETLVAFGCNTRSSNCLRDGTKKHGHLFPLAFELTGMLGKTLHIKRSAFRMLPNPTFYRWDKKYFNLGLLLKAYRQSINNLADVHVDDQTSDLRRWANDTDQLLDDSVRTEASTNTDTNANTNATTTGYLGLLDRLHDVLDQCDAYLVPRMDDVRLVLREHIQELLLMVNGEGEYSAPPPMSTVGSPGLGIDLNVNNTPNSPVSVLGSSAPHRFSLGHVHRLRFDDLMAASPEIRQKRLMEIYFNLLRPRVVSKAYAAWRRWDGSSDASEEVSEDAAPDDIQRQRAMTSVWCTLVLRMLCWLLLHDFHKMDVQLPKSELLGDRRPVYIW